MLKNVELKSADKRTGVLLFVYEGIHDLIPVTVLFKKKNFFKPHSFSFYLCSLVMDVFCRGCHSVLGMVYASTPKNLDHKRFAFCFNVADIDRCV